MTRSRAASARTPSTYMFKGKDYHMLRHRFALLLLAAVLLLGAVPALAANSALVSTMRNVNAVTESRGFYLTPATDRSGATGFGSLAPDQAFEIIRPDGKAVTIGRLYTSCTCVQLSAPKRTFTSGERAVLTLKNVIATPPQGQRYAVYVQITSPVRVTLRYDTFVQSSQFLPQPEPTVEVAAAPAAEEAESAIEKIEEKAEDVAEAVGKKIEETVEAVEAAGGAAAVAVAEAVEEAREKVEEVIGDKPAAPVSTGPIDQRLSQITLGVADLGRARKFYESLGWSAVSNNQYDGIVYFQMNGMALTLYPISELLRDQDAEGRSIAPGGITLGYNVREKADVEKTYQAFLKAGGTSIKKPEEMPWGSVVCYVSDPDGHPWEIAWVPQMSLDAAGNLTVQ